MAVKKKVKRIVVEKKKLKLSVMDRVLFGNILPERASILDQIIIRDMLEKVQFTESESEKLKVKVKSSGKGLTWEKNVVKEKAFMFTNPEIDYLQKQVKRIDSKAEVTQGSLDLCQKIQKV